MRTRLGSALLGACAGLTLTTADAGPYLGGGILSSEYKYEDVGHGTGSRFFAGYRFDTVPLLIEGGYIDLGDADIKSAPGLSLRFKGAQAAIGYFGRIPKSHSGYWAKVGYYDGDSELSDSGFSVKDDSSGAFLGMGIDWMFVPWMGLSLSLENLFHVRDYQNFEPDHHSNVTVAALSLVFEVPTRRTPVRAGAASVAPAARPAPAAQPSAAVQSAPAAAAPAPAAARAPMPAALPPAGPATVKLATWMYRQPQTSAYPERQIAAGGKIDVRSCMALPQGSWCYVEHEGAIGWIDAAALQN